MNQNYRIVYNDSLGVWQCVPELAKTKGKTASGNKIVQLGVLATAMAASSSAIADVNIDHDRNANGLSYNEQINIASTNGTQATVTVNNAGTFAMTAAGPYDPNNPHDNRIWLGVGHRGNGTLNVDNATVTSADSIALGVRTTSNGTVNLSNNAIMNAQYSIIIGDGSTGSMNVNSGSFVGAKDIWVATSPHVSGTINVDGAGSGVQKTQLNASDFIVVGDEGTGVINVTNDGIISTQRIRMVGEAVGHGSLNISSGGNVIVNNIERGSNIGTARVHFDAGDIKIEGGNQSNFFKDFTSVDSISITNGLEFNTNGHNVTINPNAVMRGNAGRTNIVTGGGFEKTGQGTLTISENTIRNVSGDIAVSEGTLQINGNHRFANGDTLYIGAHSPTDYGKFHVSGNLDVSQGKLSVYAADLVRTMLATPGHNLTFNDMVKAGNLTGQFTTVNVVDDSGTPLTTSLVPQYNGNAVNLTTNPSSPPPPPPPAHSSGAFQSAATNAHNMTAANGVAQGLDNVMANHSTSPLANIVNGLQSIGTLTTDAQRAQFAGELQPVINAQTPQIIHNQYNLATGVVSERLFQTRANIAQGSDNGEDYRLFKPNSDLTNSVWIQATGQKHDADSRNGFAGFDGHSSGVVIGADGLMGDNLRLGAALAYSHSDIDSKGTANRQNLDAKMIQGYLYSDYAINDATHVNGFVGFGRADIDSTRTIGMLGGAIASANYDANISQVGIGIDHRIGATEDHISPFAQLRYTRVAHDAYQENVSGGGGAAGLTVGQNNDEALRLTAGVHFAKPLGTHTQAIGSVAAHLQNHNSTNINASFNGAPAVGFSETAQETDKFGASLSLGIRHQFSNNTEFSAQYQGEYSRNAQTHGGSVMLKYRF